MPQRILVVSEPFVLECVDLQRVIVRAGRPGQVTVAVEDSWQSRGHVAAKVTVDSGVIRVHSTPGVSWERVHIEVPPGTPVAIGGCENADIGYTEAGVDAVLNRGHISVTGAGAVRLALAGQARAGVRDSESVQVRARVQARATLEGAFKEMEISTSGQAYVTVDGRAEVLRADSVGQSGIRAEGHFPEIAWKVATGQGIIAVNREIVSGAYDLAEVPGLRQELRSAVTAIERELRIEGPAAESLREAGYDLLTFDVPYDSGGRRRVCPVTLLAWRDPGLRSGADLVVLGTPPARHRDGRGDLSRDWPVPEAEAALLAVRAARALERPGPVAPAPAPPSPGDRGVA